MRETLPDDLERAPSRSTPWLFALGLALVAAVVLRSPAQSQQGGGQGGGQPGGAPTPAQVPTVSVPVVQSGGNADSNDRMIAVTGTDLTGASVLFVIDTLDPHIAVYQAVGGSESMQGIRLVAARRIDLDLDLDGYNDKSQYSYKDLEGSFSSQGLLPGQR
jgi:hypothetical protein